MTWWHECSEGPDWRVLIENDGTVHFTDEHKFEINYCPFCGREAEQIINNKEPNETPHPEEMTQAINAVDSVSGVEKVQSNRADIVVYFENQHGPQALRTEWLKNHRDNFEIVDHGTNSKNPWMQLKAK
jgi:hypothetical protein